MESAKPKNLDLLENEIRSLYEANKALIQKIESFKINQIKALKSYNVIKFKSIDHSYIREPLSIYCEDISEKESFDEYIENWIIPASMEKPEEVDPDKLLYIDNRDIMNMECENYEDLIRINQQFNVAIKYLSLLRESASYVFGMKFKKNFEIVGNLLKVLIRDIEGMESNDDNKSKEINGKIEQINKLFIQLFEFKNILNCGPFSKKLTSNILTKPMMKMLYNMFPNKRKSFNLLYQGIEFEAFNNAVRNKGPTLFIIKNNLNYVFGAYVFDKLCIDYLYDELDEGNGIDNEWIIGSKDTFLFTFGNENNIKPIKLLHNGGNNGLYQISGCGLHLGTDLVAFCTHSCEPQVYTLVAPGYPNVQVNNILLAGAPNWTPTIIEIFEEAALY